MRFGIFNNFAAANGRPVFDAFCRGLTRLGHTWQAHDHTADVAVIWSVLWAGRMRPNRDIWTAFQNSGRPVVVLEVGMLQRGRTWKVGINGVGATAIWPPLTDPSRPGRLNIDLRPWKQSGPDIVIAVQRTDSEQWQGQPPIDQWLTDVTSQLKAHSDRPIRIRAHPRQRTITPAGCLLETPHKLLGTYDDFDFEHSLRRAWCVVNWNSGPGCQSVLQGVPAFVGPTSLAVPVASLDWTQIESPHRPDREQWLLEISHTEWTCDEIASGLPISGLLGRLESR